MELKKKLKQIVRILLNRDYRFLAQNNPPFDTDYFYKLSNLKEEGLDDPLWVYVKTEREARSGLDFNKDEWRQLPNPHALFDVFFYIAKYFPNGLKENAFAHYLRVGWKQDLWPGPYFSPDVYRNRSDWDHDQGNPLTHYTFYGAPQIISPSIFFDIDYYLDKISFLNKYKKNIIRHYKMYDAKNGKNSTPVFDPLFYQTGQTRSKFANSDPFAHYLTSSIKTKQRPNEWFDPNYYEEQVSAQLGIEDILAHYLTEGVYQQTYTDRRVENLHPKPLISVIVPVYNPDPHILNCCIRSVLYQTYPHWELCLADDCSTNDGIKEILKDWAEKDSRIKLTFNSENRGISETTNSAVNLANGDFLGLLDNDDELSLDCLFYVAETVNRTNAQVVYTDEDLIGDDSSRLSVFYKPDFNINLLYSHNYITHFLVVEKKLYWSIGGLNTDYDGAQDYDLILRLSAKTRNIVHIPRVLYHWRALDSSTSINHEQKTYAHEAGKKALQMIFQKKGTSAQVGDTELNFFYHTKFLKKNEPSVLLIIGANSTHEDVDDYQLKLLSGKPSYKNCKIVFLDDRKDHGKIFKIKNRAQVFHEYAISCKSEYIVFIEQGASELSSNWLDELLTPLKEDNDIGLTCGKVIHQSKEQTSYLVPDLANRNALYFIDFLTSYTKHMNGLHCPQLVTLCNWDFCMISRDLYENLNGFNYEKFPNYFPMLDLAFKAGDRGYKILYSPFASLTVASTIQNGIESAGRDGELEKQLFQKIWGSKLEKNDPYYNLGVLKENNIDEHKFKNWKLGFDQ